MCPEWFGWRDRMPIEWSLVGFECLLLGLIS
jgi:hypothetical protein